MSRWLVAAGLVAAACRGGGAKTQRTGSGAPVEIITQPALPDAGGGRAGATGDELEPNDSDDVATPLALGSTVRGRIEPETDVDRYQIDVAQPGALTVMVSGIEGVDLALDLEDAGGTVLARSDRGGARVREGVPNLGVTPGRYIAVVRAVPAKKKVKPKPKRGARPEPEPEKGPAPVYEITAQVAAPPAGAEHEPDDDRGTANELIIADTVTGFVGWTGDEDVWKLSVEALSARNAVDIEISAVEGVALELEIADGIGQPLITRKAPRGAPLVVRGLVPVVPAGGAPFHYLTVRGDRSNPETAYQLRVTAKVIATDAEVEPDDTLEKPFALPPDRTVVHATWTPGDVDCIAIPASSVPRAVDATIDAPPELDLVAELVVDGKPVATAGRAGKAVAPHGPASARGLKVTGQVPSGSHAVIRVRGADPAATAEGAYDVTVQESGQVGDNAP